MRVIREEKGVKEKIFGASKAWNSQKIEFTISYKTTSKIRKGGGEEIPLIQGKEQWLYFAGTVVKGYPTPKVRETQVRW